MPVVSIAEKLFNFAVGAHTRDVWWKASAYIRWKGLSRTKAEVQEVFSVAFSCSFKMVPKVNTCHIVTFLTMPAEIRTGSGIASVLDQICSMQRMRV